MRYAEAEGEGLAELGGVGAWDIPRDAHTLAPQDHHEAPLLRLHPLLDASRRHPGGFCRFVTTKTLSYQNFAPPPTRLSSP